MSQHGALTKQQAEYVALLSQGQSHVSIAKVLKVDRRTLIRWSKLTHVESAIAEANAAAQRGIAEQQQQQYKEITKSAQAATTEIVERLLPHAVKVVGTILADREAKSSDRLKAAELLSRWGGLGQQNTITTQQTSAEQTLSLYINNIAANQSSNKN